MQEDRIARTRKNLEQILELKGTAYTLGLLMGIVTRLANGDRELYREIEIRVERVKDDRWINTASLQHNSPVHTARSRPNH